MRSIIDIKTAIAVQNSSDKSNEAASHANNMAHLARIDNTIMLQLSARALKDSHTLKVITVLTLVYLPAMFVSVSDCGPVHSSKSSYIVLHIDVDVDGVHQTGSRRQIQDRHQWRNCHFCHTYNYPPHYNTWGMGNI